MIFLGTDLAIYRRLTGAPLDSKGRPRLDSITGEPVNTSRILPPDLGGGRGPSWGIRIPIMRHPQDLAHYLTSRDPDAVRMFDKGMFSRSLRQVPVFDENIQSRKWADVWPCVTFRWMDQTFRPEDFIYFDPIGIADPDASQIDIVNRNNEVIQSGASAWYTRPHPEPWNVKYMIRVWAKTPIELRLLCAQVTHLFPAKGAIDVEWMSGEVHTCDMLLDSVVTLDVDGDEIVRTLGLEEQSHYSRGFIYNIEGYADNTANMFGYTDVRHHTTPILERILEIADMQNELLESIDLNLEELEPI